MKRDVYKRQGFDDAHALDIFLYGVVERVVFFKNPAEKRHDHTNDGEQADSEQRRYNQENERHAPAHDKSHDE